jgi:hypothetical protein
LFVVNDITIVQGKYLLINKWIASAIDCYEVFVKENCKCYDNDVGGFVPERS